MHQKRNVDLNVSAFVITWIEAHTVEGNTFLTETSECVRACDGPRDTNAAVRGVSFDQAGMLGGVVSSKVRKKKKKRSPMKPYEIMEEETSAQFDLIPIRARN